MLNGQPGCGGQGTCGCFIPPLESMVGSAKTVHFGIHRVSFQIMGSMLPSDMTLRKCPNLSEPPYSHLLDENKNLLFSRVLARILAQFTTKSHKMAIVTPFYEQKVPQMTCWEASVGARKNLKTVCLYGHEGSNPPSSAK